MTGKVRVWHVPLKKKLEGIGRLWLCLQRVRRSYLVILSSPSTWSHFGVWWSARWPIQSYHRTIMLLHTVGYDTTHKKPMLSCEIEKKASMFPTASPNLISKSKGIDRWCTRKYLIACYVRALGVPSDVRGCGNRSAHCFAFSSISYLNY